MSNASRRGPSSWTNSGDGGADSGDVRGDVRVDMCRLWYVRCEVSAAWAVASLPESQ